MRGRTVGAAAIALVFLGPVHFAAGQDPAPTAPAPEGPANTILYAHFRDILNRAPLTTMPPGPEEEQIERGFTFPTVWADTGIDPAAAHVSNNRFHMFSSAGPASVVDGQWRIHQEPGLAEPVRLLGDTMTLVFYLSAHPVPGQPRDGTPAGPYAADVMPNVAIYARIETGRHPFGTRSILIAEGDTGAGDTSPLPNGDGRVTMVTLPGQNAVYEFQVPLRILEPVIPSVWQGTEGILASVHVYQLEGDAADGAVGWEFTQGNFRVHAGPLTPPRLVFDVEKPLVHKAADLVLDNTAPALAWSVASPWGSYDVDRRNFTLRMEGPDGSVLMAPPDRVKVSFDHDGLFKPVTATWRIDPGREDLPDGEYAITASVPNLQGYKLQHTERLLIEGNLITRVM